MERIVGGKKFEFAEITFAAQAKIEKLQNIPFWVRKSKRTKYLWNKICRTAFKKNFLWKYLRIIPSELGFDNIAIDEFGGIQADFFAYYAEKLTKFSEQRKRLDASKLKTMA
jgi:hypothetical protein